MDPSKFSLKEATEAIRPYLEHLSFSTLRDYVHGPNQDLQDDVDGLIRHLQYRDANLFLPSNVSLESRVHAVPVQRLISSDDGRVYKIQHDRLFVYRVRGADVWYGFWLFQRTVFAPADKRSVTFFNARESKICYADEDEFAELVAGVGGFPEKFRKHLHDWATDSMRVRSKALESLGQMLGRFSSSPEVPAPAATVA